MKWDDLAVFGAVHVARSIKGAARALGVDHSTVSRRLAALEEDLGARLFHRTDAGLRPTEVGLAIAPLIDRVASLAREIEDLARRTQASLAGPVRIATSPVLAEHWLIPRLAELKRRFPDVEIEVKAGIERVDVSRREADLAIRQHPPGTAPGEPSVLAQKLGRCAFALYASPDYVARRGLPESPVRGLRDHTLVVLSAEARDAEWNRALDPPAEALVAFPYSAATAAAAQGLGLCVLPCLSADPDPRLARVGEVLWHYELWLVSNQEDREHVRIRAVRAALVEMLEASAGAFAGER